MVLQVSEVYRKVGEVGAVIFLYCSSKSDFMEPSYGQKTVLSERVLNSRVLKRERGANSR